MSGLREARDYLGLSREKVAAKVGISSKTLERWEKGETPVKRYQLQQLAEVYGVSVDDLEKAAA